MSGDPDPLFTPSYGEWLCREPLKPIPREALVPSTAEAIQRAIDAMKHVTVWVTSRQQIKKPEGHDWWQAEIAALEAALGDLK